MTQSTIPTLNPMRDRALIVAHYPPLLSVPMADWHMVACNDFCGEVDENDYPTVAFSTLSSVANLIVATAESDGYYVVFECKSVTKVNAYTYVALYAYVKCIYP